MARSIREVEVEFDARGRLIPQRVPVDIGVYPASTQPPCPTCIPLGSTADLPEYSPFGDQISDRALTDADVSVYMIRMATGVTAPGSEGSWPMSLNAIHWLRQVIATPAEDGSMAT